MHFLLGTLHISLVHRSVPPQIFIPCSIGKVEQNDQLKTLMEALKEDKLCAQPLYNGHLMW